MSKVQPWSALVAAREKRGWSRFRLASEMRINLSHLGKLEKGESKPRMNTISRAAHALGVPVARLIGENQAQSTSTDQQWVTHKEMEIFVHEEIEKSVRDRK
jgi:transcriptional regulator with XRE-family HTH domain